MDNVFETHTDGINVYATLKIKSSLLGRILLSICNIILICLWVTFVSSFNAQEMGKMLIPVVLMLAFIIFLPLRYLIWNIAGREFLIVNTKSISYNFDYGIIKTNLKTIKYNRLGWSFNETSKEKDVAYGRLVFYNYSEDTDVPEIIHHTSIVLTREEIFTLETEINNLFEELEFPNFSLN